MLVRLEGDAAVPPLAGNAARGGAPSGTLAAPRQTPPTPEGLSGRAKWKENALRWIRSVPSPGPIFPLYTMRRLRIICKDNDIPESVD